MRVVTGSLHSHLVAIVSVIVISLLLSSCVALVRPNFETEVIKLREGQYTLDPRHSFVLFKVGHLGLSTYVGRFNEFQAVLEFDPDNLPATTLQGVVEMASVDTGDTEVDSLLSEPDWLDTARFPQAEFITTQVQDIGSSQIAISGALTLRGVTRDIKLTGTFNGGADNLLTRRYTLGFTATGQFSRSEFGIDGFSGLVGDAVAFEVFAEFLRAQ